MQRCFDPLDEFARLVEEFPRLCSAAELLEGLPPEHDANVVPKQHIYNYAAFCLQHGRIDDRIKHFKAKPLSIFAGEKCMLSWSTANANSVEIDNGVGGGKEKSGKFEVPCPDFRRRTGTSDDSGPGGWPAGRG